MTQLFSFGILGLVNLSIIGIDFLLFFRIKLQLPDLSCVPIVPPESHSEDPQDHGGRVRSFPHVRGNWATFIYVKYPEEESLLSLSQRLLGILSAFKDSCHVCDNVHISLSKTVVLQYHLITPFTRSLQEVFRNIDCFCLDFSGIKLYCNEENTRTFIALEVDYSSKRRLLQLSQNVDDVLKEYKLPLFYENPSFHMSIIWLTGDKKAELSSLMSEFNNSLNKELGNTINPVLVSDLNCKIGNKYFQFTLQ
ncbi:U6 snRNA phosphodiesterase [Ostrinia furnacalis]|uniref:U6 snRNA phosphodiesterase n=1 Tax=Ostrinia furnacalis TaxID=93504 RepID=UPI00103E172E|nr:U6 snRNA phosphodiesterase [Ostrinia furnacalis]